MLSPEERTLRARAGAYALHAKRDPRETTAAATSARFQKFLDEVDPERKLPEAERIRRAEWARRSYMATLAMKAATKRRKAAEKKSRAAADGEA